MSTSTQWQLAHGAAERYERILVPAILGPFARELVLWANLRSDENILDAGCGTGAAARFAAEILGLSGHITGLDLNPGMIEVARSIATPLAAQLSWQEGSIYELPWQDGTFDGVLCAQTLQFLDRRPAALAELFRVLKPGGRLALSLWADIQESPYFDALVSAVAHHIDRDTAQGLGAAFYLTDPGEIFSLLEGSGFQSLQLQKITLHLDLPYMAEFVPRHISATPMVAGFQAAPRRKQQAVIDEMLSRFAAHMRPDGTHRVPFSSYFARGFKPHVH